MLSNVRTWIVMACYRRLSLNEKQYCLSDYEVVSMNRLAQVPLFLEEYKCNLFWLTRFVSACLGLGFSK